jgi:hypothetical protein
VIERLPDPDPEPDPDPDLDLDPDDDRLLFFLFFDEVLDSQYRMKTPLHQVRSK